MDIIGHPQGETQGQGSYRKDFFQFLQLHGHALPFLEWFRIHNEQNKVSVTDYSQKVKKYVNGT